MRFLTAHLAGSSVYIAVFLALGATFGPQILERIHPPALTLRLLWLLPLAVGLPLLMIWWGSRTLPRRSAEPSRRWATVAVLLGGFAGTTALAATWSATTTVADLLGRSYTFSAPYSPLDRLLNSDATVGSKSLLVHAALLSLFIGIGVAYYEFILPYLAPRGLSLPQQALGLGLLAPGLFGALSDVTLLATRSGSLTLWWQTGGPIMLIGTVLGLGIYALTTTYTCSVAIAGRHPHPAVKRSNPLHNRECRLHSLL